MASSLNPNPDDKPPQSQSQTAVVKVREEGELSSSDDELATYQSAPSTSISAPPSSNVPNVSAKTLQVRNSGKLASAGLPARASDKFLQGKVHSKGFTKNKVLLKSTNPGWRAPGGNANLVISFSDDDDSGSDGERKQKTKTAQVSNRHQHVVVNTQRPPSLPHPKPDTARRTAKNVVKAATTKKVGLSRTFISSTTTKIHGSIVKGTGPPLAQRRSSWSKNSNATGKILPSQDNGGFSKQVDLSSSKLQDLQDLRQQIAMRENELKLKKVQKNKENVSELSRDIDVMGQTDKVSSKRGRTVSAGEHTDTEEPDMKRLKLADNSSGQPSSSSHKDKSVVLTPSYVSGHLHQVTKVGLRELLPRASEMQIQNEKWLPPLSHNERSTLLQGAAGVGASCSLSDWVSRPLESSAIPEKTGPSTDAIFADHLDKTDTDLVNKNMLSSSVPNHDMCISNMNEVNDCHDAVSAHEKNRSNNALQDHSLQVSDSKFESLNASPDNTSALQSLDRPTVSGRDVDSLFEMEDICDKELEEAQEHRRRCEIEERNALKAYHRAQRALVEANARCTYLYRNRELYSAKLRSFLMKDPNLFLTTSRHHGSIGDTWNLSYNVCEANVDVVPPMSSHQLQAEYEPDNQVGYGSNAQSAGNEDANNLGSETCSDRDASTSDVLIHGNSSAANGVRSPSNDPNFSPDDCETFPLDHRSLYDGEEGNARESDNDMNADMVRCFALGSSQDLDLEASLRTTLLASRLGVKDSSKKSSIDSDSKSAAPRIAEENVAEDLGKLDCRISKTALDIENRQPLADRSLNNSQTLAFDSEEAILQSRGIASTPTISSSSILRSAIVIMAACRSKLNDVQTIDLNGCSPSSTHNEDDLLAKENEDKSSLGKESCPIVEAVSFGRLDLYTFKGEIDPFKPLCLYELRGRCNDSECPSQHLRGNSSRNVKGDGSSDDADCQPGSLPNCLKQRGSIESFGILTPPGYLVSFDSLKAESHCHACPFAHQIGASRKNFFSNSLAVSNALVKLLPSDEPFLHGNDGCVDYFVGSGHSLYFQSRNGAGNPLRKSDNEQALEIALLSLNQAVNRFDGMTKALAELSLAIEADPESFQLWIVYLLLLHSIMSSDSELSKVVSSLKDSNDIFSKAVERNTKSYELWLMFINSRKKLNDRFAAYVRAISCLLHHDDASSPNDEHSSAVILDLFLQMLYCFCISGNITEAVQKIQGLTLPDRDSSDESHSLLLSDILKCLTIPDKCIFWVSCVYLMMYRKLPDALVHQFEFEKDISVIEWPSVRLTLEEKQQVFKLMEMAVDCVDIESSESGNHQKSAYWIRLNHVKLMAAVDGEGSCKMLLEKYKNDDPPCLQLVLLSSRAHGNTDDENTTFEGFEEALSNWPKDVSGIQCIWNQFAEYALKTGRLDRAKEIMDQWFHSVWKPLFGDGCIDSSENENERTSLLNPLSGSVPSNSSNIDILFGLLNLSLLRLFQNNILAAHVAIDEALRIADVEVLRHCVREHAAFLFNYGSQLRIDVSLRGLIDILKGYMIHAQSVPGPRCLTTKFIHDFKRPRVRQLVSNLLCPDSPDSSSLVNSVLDIWFGPSMLPQNTEELRDLVDFVESVVGLSPGNYQVAISTCRLICERQESSEFKSPSVLFWASSLLVNTIYQAFPVPPEFVWVEAADLLGKLTDKQEICESFRQRALSVYPFSVKLRKTFLNKAANG